MATPSRRVRVGLVSFGGEGVGMRGFGLLVGIFLAQPAWATWSIVAVDPVTGEAGAAGATCSPFVWVIGEVVPGHGALVAQAATNLEGKRLGADQLEAGQTPTEVIAHLGSERYDDQLTIRQYGVAAFSGPASSFTGLEAGAVAGSITYGDLSVQGNTLVDIAVVEQTTIAFENAAGAPLAERLVAAMEAGAAVGGDSRCDAEDAAKTAFLEVADAEGTTVRLKVRRFAPGPPVAHLREEWERVQDGRPACASAPGSAGPWGIIVGLLLVGRRVGRGRPRR